MKVRVIPKIVIEAEASDKSVALIVLTVSVLIAVVIATLVIAGIVVLLCL